MRVVETIIELREHLDAARRSGQRVGFVPTMGYLHDGHASNIRRSVAECDLTAVTIFVNPLQFGAGEDLASYPRDLPRDLALCESAGVDIVLTPSVEEMYPEPVRTVVSVPDLSGAMEGVARPTHFSGVATVVAKLFNIVGPCAAYFGEKDYQQLAIVRRMAGDLSFPVDVIGCATVREPDGLAMSSRNVYLDPAERSAATVLWRALGVGAATIEQGERDPVAVEAVMARTIGDEPLADLDYACAVDASTLVRPDQLAGEVRLLVAARVGKPRLLDNVGVNVPAG